MVTLPTIQNWAVQKQLDPKRLSEGELRTALAELSPGEAISDATVTETMRRLATSDFGPAPTRYDSLSTPVAQTRLPSLGLGELRALTAMDLETAAPPVTPSGIEKYLRAAGYEQIVVTDAGISASRWQPDGRGDLRSQTSTWPSIAGFVKEADEWTARITPELRPQLDRVTRFAEANGFNVVIYQPHRNAFRLDAVSGLHTSDQPVVTVRQAYVPIE